jgi:hypothetical protein
LLGRHRSERRQQHMARLGAERRSSMRHRRIDYKDARSRIVWPNLEIGVLLLCSNPLNCS